MRNIARIFVAAGVASSLTAVLLAQGSAVNSVMREKLQHSQKMLEAVVTSNWTSLDTHTRALERLTDDPRWTVLKYPEYAKYSNAFKLALRDLQAAAAAHDLEKTPEAYNVMTTRCVECHRYLARIRMAK